MSIILACAWLSCTLLDGPLHAGQEQSSEALIAPLAGKVTKSEGEPALEDLNQCAGSIKRYRFPPSGYSPERPSPRSEKGRALYEKLQCAQCHAISGKGGNLGPPLDGIGGHRGQQFLTARLLDPEAQMRAFPDVFGGRPNIMPHPGVSKARARLIADYLLTLPEPEGGFMVTAHPPIEAGKEAADADFKTRPESDLSRRGRQVFVESRCSACHSVDGSGGRFGPDLAGVGSRKGRAGIDAILAGAVRSPVMQAQAGHLKQEDIESVREFLLTLPPPARPPAERKAEPFAG